MIPNKHHFTLVLSLMDGSGQNNASTMNANYTWSHCITDPGGDKEFNAGGIIPWLDPNNRHLDRGNCFVAATDRRHLFNLSAVAETPGFSNRTLRTIGSGWRFSPIFKIISGGYM